jgi:sec-independent protein translocase protein TatC
MADVVASIVVASTLPLPERAMPFLAHLEELRRRIIGSILGVLIGFFLCWTFADRLFGLMQQPIIPALRHHGIGEGLVYLNPTEPFNLYLMVALVLGLFAASPFVLYQFWLFIAPGLYRTEKRDVLPFLNQYGGAIPCRWTLRLQDGLSGLPGLPDRLR